MTDEERGKSKDAEEEGTPSEALPSPPTPPPPDVSMFDDALQPVELPDMVGADEAPPRMASSPHLDAKSDEDKGAVREEHVSQLDLSDAVDQEEGRSSAPGSDLEPEPRSARRARRTLKIPDDDVPLSSPQPPQVEEAGFLGRALPDAADAALRVAGPGGGDGEQLQRLTRRLGCDVI